jgi:hypothetical protein
MQLLFELYKSQHLEKRRRERFSKGEMIKIGYNDDKHRGGDFIFIGEGPINPDAIDLINDKINRLSDINVNPKRSYAVKLGDIKPNLNTIKFDGEFNKENTKYQILYFVFSENGKNSGGNTAYVIIRNNIAETIMYSKNKDLTRENANIDQVYRDFDEFAEKENKQLSLKEQIKEEIRNYIIKQVLK